MGFTWPRSGCCLQARKCVLTDLEEAKCARQNTGEKLNACLGTSQRSGNKNPGLVR